MDSAELHRIDIKNRLLNTETARIEKQSQQISIQLKNCSKQKAEADRIWMAQIKKTIQASRDSPLRDQQYSLGIGLQGLKKQLVHIKSIKNREQVLQEKLGNLGDLIRLKKQQANFCQEKAKKLLVIRAERQEQAELDEKVVCCMTTVRQKCCLNETDANFISDLKRIQVKDPASLSGRQLEDFGNKVPEESFVMTDSKIMQPAIISSLSVQSDHQPGSWPSLAARNESDQQEGNSLRWEKADRDSEVMQQQNKQIRLEVLETSAGPALSLDYGIEPGRLISMEACRARGDSMIRVQIESSDSLDRRQLEQAKDEIEQSSKTKISIL